MALDSGTGEAARANGKATNKQTKTIDKLATRSIFFSKQKLKTSLKYLAIYADVSIFIYILFISHIGNKRKQKICANMATFSVHFTPALCSQKDMTVISCVARQPTAT